MTAIQAATINVARTFRKYKDYGSVEIGKVADLSIIEGDPLADIWMTQNVKMVVLDGKPVDPAFTGFVNPIPEFNSWQQLSGHIVVEPFLLTQSDGPTIIKLRGKGLLAIPRVAGQRQCCRNEIRFAQRVASGGSRRLDRRSVHVSRHSAEPRRACALPGVCAARRKISQVTHDSLGLRLPFSRIY